MEYVPASSPNKRVRAVRLKRIMSLSFLLATILPIGGCHGQSPTTSWNSLHIPTYQPLPVDVSGFPSATDKAKLAQIASYMRERLVAHHVDAAHANAILWQFHFFAPVKYLDEDCSAFVDLLHKGRFNDEDEQIGRMGDAAEDVFDRYGGEIPHSPLASGGAYDAGVNIGGRLPQSFPIYLEFDLCMRLPNVPPNESPDIRVKRYARESCRIASEIKNREGFYGKTTLTNFHIRNFIINIVQAKRAI